MTGPEAAALAVRFQQTWPRGPSTELWADTFADLEAGQVGTSWAQLSKTTNTLTIPRFHEHYQSLHMHDASTKPARKDCDICQNSGWQPIVGIIQCADGTTIDRDIGVEPCRCPWGSDRDQVHRNIIRANVDELERLQPGQAARKAAKAGPSEPLF